MNEYIIYFKQRLSPDERWSRRYDILISAFNSSERVISVFRKVSAKRKCWVILPEYKYSSSELPDGGSVFAPSTACGEESVFLGELLSSLGDLRGRAIAVDITGFVGHYVLVLVALLARQGVERLDVYYAEPVRYKENERTRFSDECVLEVRQVAGFEGVHHADTANDLLVLAVGYDHRLVAEVANFKEHARKVLLFGLPSLKPDMYQESLLRTAKVSDVLGPSSSHQQSFMFAPAHDPFVTASLVSAAVSSHRKEFPGANAYLSPLSTKAQALGFAFYYLRECVASPCSILFPICQSYQRETSEGFSCAWRYELELGGLPAAGGGRP